jgi:hypothetical protein
MVSIGDWANATWALPPRLDPTLTCASNMNSKPHDGAAALKRRRGFSIAHGIGAIPCRQHVTLPTGRPRVAPVVLFPLRASASLACPEFLGAGSCRTCGAGKGVESGIRPAPVIILGETIAADVPGRPNATQPEPFTVSVLFIRPRPGNWQAGCEQGSESTTIVLPR